MPHDRAPLAFVLQWSRATEPLHAGNLAARLMRATTYPAALDDAIRHYREGRARWLAGLRSGHSELLAEHSEAWTTAVPLLTDAMAMERNLHAGAFEHSPALALLCEDHAEILGLLEDSLRNVPPVLRRRARPTMYGSRGETTAWRAAMDAVVEARADLDLDRLGGDGGWAQAAMA